MKLLLVTTTEDSIFKFNYHSSIGTKKIKEIDINSFVSIKGWKSIGNKVNYYKRMSAYEVIEKKIDLENSNMENKLERDNNSSETLNLFE